MSDREIKERFSIPQKNLVCAPISMIRKMEADIAKAKEDTTAPWLIALADRWELDPSNREIYVEGDADFVEAIRAAIKPIVEYKGDE